MADAASTTSNTSSGKRKRSTPLVFYAVKAGRVPGIYQTWDEARKQVQGFKNPVHKKFSTYSEAEAMMKGTSASTIESSNSKYYGVAVGQIPGVYTDYSAVQAQMKGCVGAKQKSFATRAEAQAYVDEFKRGASAPISLRGDISETSSSAAGKVSRASEGINKKLKKETVKLKTPLTNGDIAYEPGLGPLPPDAEDGFDRTIKMDLETGHIRHKTEDELNATKIQRSKDFNGPIMVYTDGSALGNGKDGAVAGVGVYFGPKDPRNVSEPLRGDRQTNQRAELTAIARALDHVPIDREVLIHSDSDYAIKCLTTYFLNWEKKGWKNAHGKPVENRDLLEPILARIREREMCKAKTKFQWIKAHAKDRGNIEADSLAVNGSKLSTPELRSAREISITLNPAMRMSETPEAKQESTEGMEHDDAAEYDQLFQELEAEKAYDQQTDLLGLQADMVSEVQAQSAQERGLEELLEEKPQDNADKRDA